MKGTKGITAVLTSDPRSCLVLSESDVPLEDALQLSSYPAVVPVLSVGFVGWGREVLGRYMGNGRDSC